MAGSQRVSLCKLWTIFDSQTGIFLENFGCDEATWELSMWFKMGFDYSQLNIKNSVYNYQARATNGSQSFFPITTNADVNATQSLALMVNSYGSSQYSLQAPLSAVIIKQHAITDATYADTITYDNILNTTMTETQDSTVLTAARKPEKQIYGYYTIRSSLIDNSQYFSEDVMLPVISVLSKNYTGTDFIFSEDDGEVFTVTKPTTITNITTGIYMPNGKLARADPRSAVIYKIQKAFNYNPNIAETLLASGKKK